MLKLKSQLLGQGEIWLYITTIDVFPLVEAEGHDFMFGNGKFDSDGIFETSDGYVTD